MLEPERTAEKATRVGPTLQHAVSAPSIRRRPGLETPLLRPCQRQSQACCFRWLCSGFWTAFATFWLKGPSSTEQRRKRTSIHYICQQSQSLHGQDVLPAGLIIESLGQHQRCDASETSRVRTSLIEPAALRGGGLFWLNSRGVRSPAGRSSWASWAPAQVSRLLAD